MPQARSKDTRSPRRRARAQSTDTDPSADYAYTFCPVLQVKENRDALHYSLEVRQQPARARMVGNGEKADRRPIDPPPIVRLKINDARRSTPNHHLVHSPYYFCFATLTTSELPEKELLSTSSGKPFLVGSAVSSLFHLRDPETKGFSAFFVWPDLGVRVEGTFRLKLSMYEVVGLRVYHCGSVTTDLFFVFSAKRFPGMDGSTALSRAFADQGIRLRVRSKLPHKSSKRRKVEPPQSAQAWRTIQDDSGHRATQEYPDALASVCGTPPSHGDYRSKLPPGYDEPPSKRSMPQTHYDPGPGRSLPPRHAYDSIRKLPSSRSFVSGPPSRSPTGTSLPSLTSMLHGAPAAPSYITSSRHDPHYYSNQQHLCSPGRDPEAWRDPHTRSPLPLYFTRDAQLSPQLPPISTSTAHGSASYRTPSIPDRLSASSSSTQQGQFDYAMGQGVPGYAPTGGQQVQRPSSMSQWTRSDASPPQFRNRVGEEEEEAAPPYYYHQQQYQQSQNFNGKRK